MKRLLVVATIALAGTLAAWAQAPKKGYIIGMIDVTNPAQYAEYTKLTPALIDKFGGKFVARGGRTSALEGAAPGGRIVIIEYPSFERAQEFYNSAEYTEAKKKRAGAANVQFVLVEGM